MSELRPDAANANELVAAELVAAELNDSVVHGEDLMPEVDALVQHGIAVGIATIAHRGQLDKLGDDYVDHPARVAENFDWLNEPVEHCTAWLHDVIEDTDISASDLLKAGMLPEIVAAVELLTRRADVADADYYDRIRQHPAALAVKLADINDNLADWRFRKLDHDTQVRLSNKYFQAQQLLQPTSDEIENP
jgi:(p)ppGpp synthase/HD superfamily hydrolase